MVVKEARGLGAGAGAGAGAGDGGGGGGGYQSLKYLNRFAWGTGFLWFKQKHVCPLDLELILSKSLVKTNNHFFHQVASDWLSHLCKK